MNSQFLRLSSGSLKEKIRSRKLKMYWVADATGVHKTTLRRWLSRKINQVSSGRAQRLATVLGAELHEILEADVEQK
jgi:transcriptional regulator with XRE-family HTH domain